MTREKIDFLKTAFSLLTKRYPLCVWSAISAASCLEFRELGLPLYRVYGLAEACGLAALEGPSSTSKIHLAVGKPIPGLEVKIGSDRQVLIRGATVCSDYAAAKVPLSDGGFFPTGDFGRFEAGQLVLQGRLSDVFALQSGAVVEPLDPECQLREHPFISHAIVAGKNQNFAVAFLTLDRTVMEPVAKQRGISVAQLASSPLVATAIKSHVDRINVSRQRDVRIRKFVILGAVRNLCCIFFCYALSLFNCAPFKGSCFKRRADSDAVRAA